MDLLMYGCLITVTLFSLLTQLRPDVVPKTAGIYDKFASVSVYTNSTFLHEELPRLAMVGFVCVGN